MENGRKYSGAGNPFYSASPEYLKRQHIFSVP